MDSVIASFPAPRMVLQHSTIDSVEFPFSFWIRVDGDGRKRLIVAFGVLDYAVPQLLAKGYQLVTVDTCLGGGDPYKHVGEPGKQDGYWTC